MEEIQFYISMSLPVLGSCAQQAARCSKWYGFEQRHLTCMMIDLAGQNYVLLYCNHNSENKITVQKKKATAAPEVTIIAVLAGDGGASTNDTKMM